MDFFRAIKPSYRFYNRSLFYWFAWDIQAPFLRIEAQQAIPIPV